jgi:hypothetical protein
MLYFMHKVPFNYTQHNPQTQYTILFDHIYICSIVIYIKTLIEMTMSSREVWIRDVSAVEKLTLGVITLIKRNIIAKNARLHLGFVLAVH